MKRGDIAWLDLEVEGRRPVCVLTRDQAIPALSNIVVAAITKNVRGVVSEVLLGPDDGLPRPRRSNRLLRRSRQRCGYDSVPGGAIH